MDRGARGVAKGQTYWATEHIYIPCFIPRKVRSASFPLYGYVPVGA